MRELTSADYELVRAHFDLDFYRRNNPDVVAAGIDEFSHFLTSGWVERRDPSEFFSVSFYLEANPDIKAWGVNPFVHWVLYGQSEGRLGTLATKATAITDPLAGLSASDIDRLRNAFDPEYYITNHPDLRIGPDDPFMHYMTVGWLENKDPAQNFSTAYYLQYHPDIARSGMNPFVHWVLHGIEEQRKAISFRRGLDLLEFSPKVSVVVPNFNHSKWLPERLDSILNQTYRNFDVLVLDDCSSDSSREVIARYVEKSDTRIRTLYNDKPSGGVFHQWRKGIENSDGDLVWICESDDSCEPEFLEKLIYHFRDQSVMLAFGRILNIDSAGVVDFRLDNYREEAEAGIWAEPFVRPAAEWFRNGFGVNNVVANVGGCVFRRQSLADDVWQEALSYRVTGDWYLYCHLAAGGQIAWEPKAVSHFRRHGKNTSNAAFITPQFYREFEKLMLALKSQWDIPEKTVEKFFDVVARQYEMRDLSRTLGPIEAFCNQDKLKAAARGRRHILMAFYGFVPGGGEAFPIALANRLRAAGYVVSMLAFQMEKVYAGVRASLDPGIAVYDFGWVTEYGADRFLAEAGVDLIHSHTLGAELYFFDGWKIKPGTPYLVTLHGSYEASELNDDWLFRAANRVDHFVYTANRNLRPLCNLGISPFKFTKLPNAMPIDPQPFPQSRAELGIAEDTVVFTLVARGIIRKGWRAAIGALQKLRERRKDRNIHLLLCGDGDVPDQHKKIHGEDPDITFLGYQSRINGLYRLSDVAVVPTRFSGESYPLCIIQALQVGTPIIGSRVGEIESMISPPGERAGIVIDAVRDTEIFIESLTDAMEEMLDDKKRAQFAASAARVGLTYDMDRLVNVYSDIYEQLMSESEDGSSAQKLVGKVTESA
jgi:glycosyltransferase involved in cell wall biosynthesis